MLGGQEVRIPTKSGPLALTAAASVLLRLWSEARFVSVATGKEYKNLADLDTDEVDDLFVYRDQAAKEAWDKDFPAHLPNSMVEVIHDPGLITVVMDDREVGDMPVFLDELRQTIAYLDNAPNRKG